MVRLLANPRIIAIIDTREQLPLSLEFLDGEAIPTERGTLATGDYSIKGLENLVAVERKSLPDLMGCIGRDRERFEREIQRMKGIPSRCLVVEASWDEIGRGEYRSKVNPRAAIGTLIGWMVEGIPIAMVGNHQAAGRFVGRFLSIFASRKLRELKALVQK